MRNGNTTAFDGHDKVISFPGAYHHSSLGDVMPNSKTVAYLKDYAPRASKAQKKPRNKPASREEKQLEAMRRISEPDFPSTTLDQILDLINQAERKRV